MGFMTTIPINRRLVGYTKSESFERKLEEISGN
jgi:hypothetical protein